MDRNRYEELDRIFHPANVAIIGASPVSDIATISLMSTKMKDYTYFVNPKYDEILGRKCYSSILDIREPIDYVIIGVKAAQVSKVVSECIQKGVKAGHIFSSGFSETGLPEAIELEKQLREVSRGKIRLIGPNCFGIYCPRSGLAIIPESSEEEGNVGVIAQSGSVAEYFCYYGKTKNLRFSKVVSYGNAIDLDCPDFLEYLADDPQTKVIALYIEGSKDGMRVKEALTYAAARKPVIAIKGGLTDSGRRVAASHTAQLTGTPEVWESLFRQCGVVQVKNNEELVNAVIAFSHSPLPAGNRVSLLSNSGGFSVIQTDLCAAEGITVPRFSDSTIEKLKKYVPLAGTSIGNPLDAWPVFYRIHEGEGNLSDIIGIIASDSGIDSLIIQFDQFRYIRRALKERAEEHMRDLIDLLIKGCRYCRDVVGKPVLACVVLEPYSEDEEDRKYNLMMKRAFERGDFPVFPSLDAGVKALSHLYKYTLLHPGDIH